MKLKPAIKVKGKIFTAKNHAMAIKKARNQGYSIKLADKNKLGKFKNGNKLLTRKQTKKRYGVSHSHQLKNL